MRPDQPPVAKRSPGRPGITRQDVASAVEALDQRGITDPSLTQLREHLGRGSHTTIARWRQQIRAEQLRAGHAPVAGSLEATVLPVLATVMEKLGEEAAAAADAHVEAMRAEFEATNRTMQHARDTAEQQLRDMRLEYHAREEQITDARETSRSLQAMLGEERKRWEQMHSALEKQRSEALEGERQALGRATHAEGQQGALEARLKDAQHIIEGLINRVGNAPGPAD